MLRLYKYTFLLFFIFSCTKGTKNSKAEKAPNVIIIYTDDQGYGDLSSYGSMSMKTPNIDMLGSGGATFYDFLVGSSTCSPSRAALLTGAYPIRTGVVGVLWPKEGGGFGGKNKGLVGLHPNEVTIAEVLKDNGYATAMAGKWHLGSQAPFMPKDQGFDSFLGIPYSNNMNVEKLPLYLDNKIIEVNPNQSLFTYRFTNFAIDFIEKKANKNPFFVYLAHPMPHIPIYASEKFQGTSKGSTYGDVIQEIDHNVGRLVKKLKEKNVYDNTIIIYTSDNGPWLAYGNHGGTSGELRGGKFDVFEGGYRVPCVMSWPNGIAPNTKINHLVSAIYLMPTICAATGAELPANKIDGVNVLDLLQDKPMPELEERFFYYHKEYTLFGVRQGKWKYLAPSTFNYIEKKGEDGSGGITTWQVDHEESLYNLETDVRELDNRLQEFPDKVNFLKEELARFQMELNREKRPIGFINNLE